MRHLLTRSTIFTLGALTILTVECSDSEHPPEVMAAEAAPTMTATATATPSPTPSPTPTPMETLTMKMCEQLRLASQAEIRPLINQFGLATISLGLDPGEMGRVAGLRCPDLASKVSAVFPTPSPTATPGPPTPTPGPRSDFGAGTWRVGTDILPGTYRTDGPARSNCYWARLSGFSGTTAHIIANDNTNGPAIVTIAASDAGFESSGCRPWARQ